MGNRSKSMAGTIRETLDGRECIKVFACYGYGSTGALYWVSLPNDPGIQSPTGMGEEEIRKKYPRVSKTGRAH